MNTHPSTDHKILDKLTEAIENNLQNEQFGVPELAEAAGLSKSQLNRRLQTITYQSASQFIREYRLKKANELLQSKAATPTEVAYKVGFSSPSYFSTSFKEFYGYSPGEAQSRTPEGPKKSTKIDKKLILIPMVILILVAAGFFAYKQLMKADDIPSIVEQEIDRSIAVLPFKNLSNKEEDLYLTDGVMMAIHQDLSRFGDLSLRSVTTTEVFRERIMTIKQSAKDLQVAYILEGSFQKQGDRALLLVRLIDTSRDKVVWDKEFNKNWSDIFAVQKEVAMQVAEELHAYFSEETQKGLDVIPTTDMEAYDLYLKAAELQEKGSSKVEEIEKTLLKAIEMDPDFALPYVRLGYRYSGKAAASFGVEKSDMIRKAKWYLQRAIELDPYNGYAYSVLAIFNWRQERDSIAANNNFEIALKLAPNDWTAVRGYYYHQYYLGNCEKMRSIINKIQEIEPHRGASPTSIYNLIQLECEDRYVEITEIGNQYLNNIVEKAHWSWKYIFNSYIYLNEYEKAQSLLDAMPKEGRGWGEEDKRFLEAILQARLGRSEAAQSLIDEGSGKMPTRHIDLARLYEAMGDEENMYAQLEQALLNRESGICFLSATGFFEHQEDPRFQDIVARSWTPISY